MDAVLGRKLRMSQVWKDHEVVPVTIVSVIPHSVSLLRTHKKDGYSAVQLRLGKRKREFHIDPEKLTVTVGDTVTISSFQEGDFVKVSGISKGKGFQGVVKRYGFAGGPKTHGQKNRHRAPGSIGSTAPQRVVPGRRMAGHMGSSRVSIKNLVVANVDEQNNLLMIKGALPGAIGGLLEIQKIVKR